MTDEIREQREEVDETLLLVSGSKGDKFSDKEYVKKLSNAILSCFAKQKTALLRYVGAASGNNAIKAIAIAIEEAARNGNTWMADPSFTTIKFGDEEKTGIILEIVSV